VYECQETSQTKRLSQLVAR